MVQINIGRGQGLTQAIRDKIGAGNIKHSNLETWQKVMTEVNSAQSKEKSIFNTTENNTTDINKLADRGSWGANFVVDEGNVEIDDGVWNKIKALLTGKTDVTPKADTKVVQQQTFTSDSNNVVSSQSSNTTTASLESKQPATDNQSQQVQILGSNKTMTVEERDKEVKNMLGGLDMPEGIDVSVMNIAGDNCYVFKRDGKTIPLDDVKQEAQAQKTAKEHENQREQALDASQTEVKNDSVGNQVQQANHSSVQSKPQNITSSEQVQAPKVNSGEIQKSNSEKMAEAKAQDLSVTNKTVDASEVKQTEKPGVSQTDYSFLGVQNLSNKGKKVVKNGVTYQYDNEGYIWRGYKGGQKIFETSMNGTSIDSRFMSKGQMLKEGVGEIIVNTYGYSNDKKLISSEQRYLDGTLKSTLKYDNQGNEIERNEYSDGKLRSTVLCKYDAQGHETKKVSKDGDGNIVYMEDSVYNGQNKASERYMYIKPDVDETLTVRQDGLQVFEKHRVDRNAQVGTPICFKVVIDKDGNILDELPTLYKE